jgi:hypothetical protein
MVVAGPEALDQMISTFEAAGFDQTGETDLGEIQAYIFTRDSDTGTVNLINNGGEYGMIIGVIEGTDS